VALFFAFQRVKLLHEAAFTAGSITWVDGTTAGGFIQIADGDDGGFFGSIEITRDDSGTGFLHQCTGAIAKHTIMDAAFFVLANTLKGRFMISHIGISQRNRCLVRQPFLLLFKLFSRTEQASMLASRLDFVQRILSAAATSDGGKGDLAPITTHS